MVVPYVMGMVAKAPHAADAKTELMNRAWDSQLVREMLTRTARTARRDADDYRPEGLEREYGMGQDGLYRLSETQAQEILQMRLHA